jgi:hypothetical protein
MPPARVPTSAEPHVAQHLLAKEGVHAQRHELQEPDEVVRVAQEGLLGSGLCMPDMAMLWQALR